MNDEKLQGAKNREATSLRRARKYKIHQVSLQNQIVNLKSKSHEMVRNRKY
jgi:hypothetical protein